MNNYPTPSRNINHALRVPALILAGALGLGACSASPEKPVVGNKLNVDLEYAFDQQLSTQIREDGFYLAGMDRTRKEYYAADYWTEAQKDAARVEHVQLRIRDMDCLMDAVTIDIDVHEFTPTDVTRYSINQLTVNKQNHVVPDLTKEPLVVTSAVDLMQKTKGQNPCNVYTLDPVDTL